MTKSIKNPETKAEMIATLIAKGKTGSEVRKEVMEVFLTCYYSEISRVKAQLAKKAEVVA